MNELIAIVGPSPGAGHGECFIWSRGVDRCVVAVDAGGAASVGKHAGAHGPSVLILSHDDHDHINGAVALIEAAQGSLRELWVPAEWAILLSQIAKTPQSALLDGSDSAVSVDALSGDIAVQILQTATGNGETPAFADVLAAAYRNLASWRADPTDPNQGILIRDASRRAGGWYGARSVDEIIKRVRKRAGALLKIFIAAHERRVGVRFFSVDLARHAAALHSFRRSRGVNGKVTLVNAEEAPRALAVTVPPGLPYTYALTRLTVQNRRALSTLLWPAARSPRGGVIIWSDTDGDWLKDPGQRATKHLIRKLAASSAPHHASGNSAHNSVWDALRHAPGDLVVVSAGGQWNQSYYKDYTALQARRCCTWCRTGPAGYQEVRLSSTPGGRMVLQQACLHVH